MAKDTIEIKFGGTRGSTTTETAMILQKFIHTYLPPWKYASAPVTFTFMFERNPNGWGWSSTEVSEVVDIITRVGVLRDQLEAFISQDESYVLLNVALKQK